MFFTDKFDKQLELTDKYVCIKRPDSKHGHGYERKIPYSAVEKVIFQKGSFFNYGFFSLIVMCGGVTYNKKNLNPCEFSSAVEDETTLMFEQKDCSEVELLISHIKQHQLNEDESTNTLEQFWGMTYKEGKGSTATLLPEGIQYIRNGNKYLLSYSDILTIDYAPLHIVVIKKDIDSKIRLQQYKKTFNLSNKDEQYSLAINQICSQWSKNFYNALSIVLENRHLIYLNQNPYNKAENTSFENMDGYEFEKFCAELLVNNGFNSIDITPKSGDQGVDILATKDGVKYAIQCKHYSSNVGNSSVQEVYAGKNYYNCHVGVVMTNSEFTHSAVELAATTGVLLWDKQKLNDMMR